ncbi:MAG: hypothetical protein AAFS12_13700 [Cyanobacteria bacterium J06632_19]
MKFLQYKIKFTLAIGLVLFNSSPAQAASIDGSNLVKKCGQLSLPILAAPPPPKGIGEPERGQLSTAGSRAVTWEQTNF